MVSNNLFLLNNRRYIDNLKEYMMSEGREIREAFPPLVFTFTGPVISHCSALQKAVFN